MSAVRNLLLVEGKDDQHVVYALMARHGMERAFTVDARDGVDRVLDWFGVVLKAANESRVGIVLDADFDVRAQWIRVRDRLRESLSVSVPDEPVAGGFVAEIEADRRVGVWLMPDNVLPGRLEDFLRALVPEGDAVYPMADAFVAGLTGDLKRFPEQHDAKARIHAYLAVQAEPGKPYGQAITAKYLSADGPAVTPFVAWLRRLFLE